MNSIDITRKDIVSGTSQGTGIRPSWTANEGAARELEIERARLAVIAEEQKRQEEQMPINLRLSALEGEVMRLKAQVKELTNAEVK